MAVDQVWGFDCGGCRLSDYGYGTEGEATRAEEAHLKQSPGCKDEEEEAPDGA
jgi:hypothetical protein